MVLASEISSFSLVFSFLLLLFRVNSTPRLSSWFSFMVDVGGMAKVKFTISFIDCKRVGRYIGTGSHRMRRGMDCP